MIKLNRKYFSFSSFKLNKTILGIIGSFILCLLLFDLQSLKGTTIFNKQMKAKNVYNATPLITDSKYRFLAPKEFSENNYSIFLSDNKHWLPTVFGKSELKTLKGFENKDGVILQKLKLKIPKELQLLNQPIVFYIPYILFTRYQIYVNGRIISDDSGLKFPFSTGLISIIKTDIDTNGEIQIGIRGEFKSSDNGISFYLNSMVGAKNEFQNIYVEQERSANSYYNFILTLKSGFLLFFLILFLVTKPQKFMLYFLIYAICNTLATYFIMERLEDLIPLNMRAIFMFNLQLIGYSFLWLFVESIYEVKYKLQKYILLLQLLGMNLLLVFFYLGKYSVDLRLIFQFHYGFISEILLAITFLSIYIYMKRPHQIIANYSTKIFAILFSIYFSIHIWLHYLGNGMGVNSHQPVDLLFFIFVGFIAASEFLRNQVKIIELDTKINEQANEVEIGKSASRIAHDIRKPFSNLKIALDVIQQSNYDSKIIDSTFTEIKSTIEFGENLVGQILSSKKNDIIQLKPCLPSEILEKYLKLEKRTLENKGIVFKTNLRTSNSVLGEESMIISIIQNIVNNAIEAFGDQTNKIIECSFQDFQDSAGNSKCRLIITNNGPAIPIQVLNQLFKKSITYGKSKGTGIGLTGVKNIVDKISAEISVFNLSNNSGVSFEIILQSIKTPQLLSETLVSNIITDENINREPKTRFLNPIKRFAVVDDDDLIRMSWRILWTESEVELFESPEQLFNKIEKDASFLETMDLIITDQYFGSKSNLTGLDLSTHLKKYQYDRIILCSGSSPEEFEKSGTLFLKIIEKQILNKEQLSSLFKCD